MEKINFDSMPSYAVINPNQGVKLIAQKPTIKDFIILAFKALLIISIWLLCGVLCYHTGQMRFFAAITGMYTGICLAAKLML